MTSLLKLALQDLFQVLQRMPNVVLAAFTVVLCQEALGGVLRGTGASGAVIVLNVAVWLLLTLYFVAVHRFVILGEVAPHYPLVFERRNRRFFLSGLLLSLLWVVPMMLVIPVVLAFHYAGMLSTFSWALAVACLGMIVLFAALITRLSVLLPAIAVDAPGANWSNAYSDTKGYVLRIFMAYTVGLMLIVLAGALAFAVVWLVATIVGIAMLSASTAAVLARVGVHVAMAAFSVLYMTFFVALASRVFQAVADRLTAPKLAVRP